MYTEIKMMPLIIYDLFNPKFLKVWCFGEWYQYRWKLWFFLYIFSFGKWNPTKIKSRYQSKI